ncbi:MAG: alpha-L-rhamnosidase C-terminal domain-containing protein [Planctomycetota bacterium]
MTPDRAKWIWCGDPIHEIINAWMQARRTFRLATVPRKAVIGVTADSRYRLYVNGQAILRGPARGYAPSWPYDEIDIAPFLRKGVNVIAALVHQYGVGTFQYVHAGAAGFLLWGNAGGTDISTNPEWRVRPAPGYSRNTARQSRQLGFQEHFDARRDDGRWSGAAGGDRDWMKPNVRAFGAMPWHTIEPRGIPLLRKGFRVPAAVISSAAGRSAPNAASATNVVIPFLTEKRAWIPSRIPPRKDASCGSFRIPASGAGRYHSILLDFGCEVVGTMEITVRGAAGGEIVDAIVCEAARGGDPVIRFSPGNPKSTGARIILAPGRTVHETFELWGFRHLALTVRGNRRPLEFRVRLRETGYPLDIRSRFDASNNTLNRIRDICIRTQKCCMLDAYVDCPWREQAQWWGDARVQAANTFHLSADARLLARGIRSIGAQRVPNGLTYGHAPTVSHGSILPDFTLTWILTHWDYFWQTGELGLFRDWKPVVRGALDYFETRIGKNGLVGYDDRYWLFLDWAEIFKDGYPTVYNLLYRMTLRTAARLFALDGERADAARCRDAANRLEKSILRRLWDPATGSLHNGMTWAGKAVPDATPHAYALAILGGLLPGRHPAFVRDHLLPSVRRDPLPRDPSPFFIHYVFEALEKSGHGAAVIPCIERRWGDMLARGLTTTEEIWNAEPGGISLCHAWSAHPIVHFTIVLLGIRQTAPAWKEIRFAPVFTGTDRVRGAVATPRGMIESGWNKTAKGVRVFLRLPKGITARVNLPGTKPLRVSGHRSWMLPVGGHSG